MVFLKDSAVFGNQSKTSSITILLLILLPLSTAKLYTPKSSSCTSSDVPGVYRIDCSQVKNSESGFTVTVHPTKFINVECRNSQDWIDFLKDNELDLNHLDRLALSGCELPSAEFIGRPFGVGWVKFLKVEKLKGRVSEQRLNNFPGLKVLVLSNNYLGQVDADLLYGQYNLTKLDLRATQIKIPAGFFVKSKSLVYLDLSNNGLGNLEPGVFSGLENLRKLNLSYNSFYSLQPELFRGLPSLGFLDISENLLYALPNDIFRDTVNLTCVHLSGNQFIEIPENLFSHGLDHLKFVRLANNKLKMAVLPSRLFSNSSSLKVLSLVGLNMRQLPEDLLSGLVNMVALNLSKNELETLPFDLLKDTRELRTFDVSSNKLQALPDGFLTQSKKLMYLNLSRNHITSFGTYFSEEHEYALLKIDLENNELQRVHPKAFVSLRHLKVAKLAQNRLNFGSHINENLSPLHHCAHLEELDLSGNEITEMIADWVRNLDYLGKLNLSVNNISYVRLDDLEFSSHQLIVDLRHNNIGVVDVSLSCLRKNIRNIKVNLNDNPIICSCEVYPLQRYVANILTYKYFKLIVDDITCNNPPSLRGLRLSELNDVTLECTSANGRSEWCASNGVCDCWITPTNRILVIDCARRNLTEAPSWIGTRDDLHVSLDLSGNLLTRVPLMTRNGYHRVRSLNLADNRIASIDANRISKELQHLHLEHNRLSAIDREIIEDLIDSLQSLWIAGNPWVCDDTTYEWRQFLKHFGTHVVADYEDLKCYGSGEHINSWFFSKLVEFDVSDDKVVEEIIAYVIYILFLFQCACFIAICFVILQRIFRMLLM